MNEKVDLKITTDGDNLVGDIMRLAGIQPEPATEEQKQAIWDEFIRQLLSGNEQVYEDDEKSKYSLEPNRGMYKEHKKTNGQRNSQKMEVAYKLMETHGWDLKVGDVYDASFAYMSVIDEKTARRFLIPRKLLQYLISKSSHGKIRASGNGEAFYMTIAVDRKFLIETI